MTSSGKTIPDRDAEEIGFPSRRYLNEHPHSFVFLVDDLEYDRRGQHEEVFTRYRNVFDTILPQQMRHRASVHFFVNMVEAYYFADTDAVNDALGTHLEDFNGDVETIRHPKNDLKQRRPGFDEKVDGHSIVNHLDLEKVLSDPATCASLRTLFKWCCRAKQEVLTDRFQLLQGTCSPVTQGQVDTLYEAAR